MENKEIARILQETADLMEIAAEDSFRIRSYRNGATSIEGYPERVEDILKDPERKVTDIPGIGKGLAVVLQEICDHGSCERRDLLLAKFPPTALEFLKIQGLGPKSIALLFEHYRVSTIDELERLCLEQKLRVLPRMGAKLEEKVLKSIAQYRQRTGRYLLSAAEDMARELTDYLGQTPGIEQITPAGSLRRGRETVGDLDLLVTGPAATEVLERFVRFPKVEQVLGHGENKASAKVGREGLQVDVRALPRESFGAGLQYFTGSKDHNVAIRTRAVKMGLKLSEYGLYRAADETRLAGETEESIYEALGLCWIPPELRENLGEIEGAVFKDVALQPGEDPDAQAVAVEFPHLRRESHGPPLVEPVGHGQRLGMVRDGHILVTAFAGGRGHFIQGRAPVGFGCVHVQIAADVPQLDQFGETALLGALDLAQVFP